MKGLRAGEVQALFVTQRRERKVLVNSQGLNFHTSTDRFAHTFQPRKSERALFGGSSMKGELVPLCGLAHQPQIPTQKEETPLP